MNTPVSPLLPAAAVPPAGHGSKARANLTNRSRTQRALAAVPLALAFYGALRFPIVPFALVAGLTVFVAICLRWPAAWLGAIPLLLPVLDLTPWSGRLFWQEIDLFLCATLAICLWHGQFQAPRRARFPLGIGIVLGSFVLAYVVSLFIGLAPYPPLNSNALSSYYSHYNALRVARGPLWALVFLRPLSLVFRRDRELARTCLLSGVTLGLIVTAAAALWERGVLHDLLYGENRYARLQGLLDFSTPYRITGLLSSMHTGGESIDGYLALAWPCALVALLLKPSRRSLLILGACALPLGLYSSVVTFSRATYLALLLTTGSFTCGFLVAMTRRAGAIGSIVPMVSMLAALATGAFAFTYGGMLALAAVLAAFMLAAGVAYLRTAPLVMAGSSTLGAGVASVVVYHAEVTSKWVTANASTAAPLALALGISAAGLGLVAGRTARRSLTPMEFAAAATLTLALAGTLIPALLGYRMESRFSEVSRDIATRQAHWREGLALAPGSLTGRLFGAGLGSFPRLYLLNYPDKLDGLSVLTMDGANTQLEITGGKDVKVTQRLALPAFQSYFVRLKYRTTSPEATLRVRVCRRHLINPTEYNGACREHSRNVHDTGGAWATLEFSFDLGNLGVHPGEIGRAPLLIELTNRREYRMMEKAPAILEFDDIELLDAQGHDYIRNGSFSAGMDHWFPLYDFNHLPWHAKNLFVHLYVEQGALGLGLFVLLMLVVFRRGLAAANRGDLFAFGLVCALLGFTAIGTVGTLFDEPRVMLLCFLLIFALIADTNVPVTHLTPRRRGVPGAS